MSIIIAGKACKTCGKEYWLSLGHPKFYEDWLSSKGQEEKEKMEAYKNLRKLNLCPRCGTSYYDEFLKKIGMVIK